MHAPQREQIADVIVVYEQVQGWVMHVRFSLYQAGMPDPKMPPAVHSPVRRFRGHGVTLADSCNSAPGSRSSGYTCE